MENSLLGLYTFSFPNTVSDILIHLTHWQYWFWFWFNYFLVLYYLLFLKMIRSRSYKMSPKLVTSFRSHGKWGDLIVCLVPISWCTNILSNSNFILRMLEWQSESSLFTVRIRGRQWYWVYKFEIKDFMGIISAKKNVGSGNWAASYPVTLDNSMRLQLINNLAPTYLMFKEGVSQKLNLSNSSYFGLRVPALLSQKTNLVHHYSTDLVSLSQNTTIYPRLMGSCTAANLPKTVLVASRSNYSMVSQVNHLFTKNTTPLNLIGGNYIKSSHLDIVSRNFKLTTFSSNPIRLIKSDLFVGATGLNGKYLDNLTYNTPLTYRSFININKQKGPNLYFVIKQKRFSGKKFQNVRFNGNHMVTTSGKANLLEHFSLQYLSNRSANMSIFSNKRMLRTRRVLVLPSSTNITLITNSFDVMHSWYIPGLGLKLDCVPGRSTHHTIHIDHAGFYYGQCAEICGRYHHHMPIRVCALPFDHFITWWGHYGLPSLYSRRNRTNGSMSSQKFVNW